MKKLGLMMAATVAATMMGAAAHADILYSNPEVPGGGDCSWSTTCASDAGRGDDFAAQEFSIAQGAAVTSATVTELDDGPGSQPSSINWAFYDATGSGGLPGALISQGSSAVNSSTNVYGEADMTFAIPSINLAGGSYYLAVQGVSQYFDNYLANGTASSGAAETQDGGMTWKGGYEGFSSVAMTIDGTAVSAAPEPGVWALMLAGVAMIGLTLRQGRRQHGMALAA